MKGILLAAGKGTRLHPLTKSVNKHLLPIYDKPLIYYPLSVLMMANINEILVICNQEDIPSYNNLLARGSHWGLNILYKTQAAPNGIAEALIIGNDFVGDDDFALILGDNLFYGNGLIELLKFAKQNVSLGKAVIFTKSVDNPENFGVASIHETGSINHIIEKPKDPQSSLAVTGLYFYPNKALEYVKSLTPSSRGELEITDLNNLFLQKDELRHVNLGRGFTWLDTGTYASLLEAGNFISIVQRRQDLRIASLDEIAFRMGFISSVELMMLIDSNVVKSEKDYLTRLLNENSE
jgi:glucose-1-phosphate thymidylyltransferase